LRKLLKPLTQTKILVKNSRNSVFRAETNLETAVIFAESLTGEAAHEKAPVDFRLV